MGKVTGFKIFVGLVITMVAAVVGVGIYVAGSPGIERQHKLDDQRVSDLQNIASAIDQYSGMKQEKLPATLADLKTVQAYVRSITDPGTGAPYEYGTQGPTVYRLCATFDLPTTMAASDASRVAPYAPAPYPAGQIGTMSPSFSQEFWNHGAGRTCFTIDERERTPQRPPAVK